MPKATSNETELSLSRRVTDTGQHPMHVEKQIAKGAVPHRNGPIRRIAVAPFELCVGVLSTWAGLAGLFGWAVSADISAALLPDWLSILSSFLYAVAGLAIIGGIIHKIPQVEAFGLSTLAASVIIRPLIVGATLGGSQLVFGLTVNAIVVACVCGIRLWVLLSGKAVMLAERSREEDPGAAVVSRVI